MKTLVTGATGFIGSSLVRELLKENTEVKVLVRKNSDTRNIDGLDLERAYGDIRDGESVQSALKGCNTLYQTAGLYSFWEPNIRVFYDINVEGTKNALKAAFEQNLEKVIYTSSIASIGCHGPECLANEQSEFKLQKTGEHYIISKYLGELEALQFCSKGLPVVVVNPSFVIGVRDIRPTPSGQMILDILNKRTPIYLDVGLNLVDVEDVARGHILAAKKGRVGERYILGNENMTQIDYFRLIGEVSGVKPPKLKLPLSAGLAASYIYQAVANITKKRPPITPGVIRANGKYWYFDCSKAVNELNFSQTPIRTTIEKAVNWFRENGYVKKS